MGSRAGDSFAFLNIAEAIDYIRATKGRYSLQQELELALRWEREGGRTPEEALQLRRAIIEMQQDLFHHGNGGPSFLDPDPRISFGGGDTGFTGELDWSQLSGDSAFGGEQAGEIGAPDPSFDNSAFSSDVGGEG